MGIVSALFGPTIKVHVLIRGRIGEAWYDIDRAVKVPPGTTLNAFVGRLWTFAGYQRDLSSRWYVNARAGLGVHLWRTDQYGAEERKLIPAGDLNLGARF